MRFAPLKVFVVAAGVGVCGQRTWCPLSGQLGLGHFEVAYGHVPAVIEGYPATSPSLSPSATTLEDCADTCLADQACRAFVWGPASGGTLSNDCIRHSTRVAATGLVPSPSNQSWYRLGRCAPTCPASFSGRVVAVPNTRPKFSSSHISDFVATTVASCESGCESAYSCQAFTFVKDPASNRHRRCQLYAKPFRNAAVQMPSTAKDLYYVTPCSKPCTGASRINGGDLIENFRLVRSSRPRNAGGFYLQLNTNATRDADQDVRDCAAACDAAGDALCASFTFHRNVASARYGNCRLYSQTYSMRYLVPNNNKDYWTRDQPRCHHRHTFVPANQACPTLAPTTVATRRRPHPCDMTVIAALGDSLTMATNALSTSLVQCALAPEWTGLAWSIGHDSNRDTVPGFFRESCGIAPEGASLSDGPVGFNFAQAGAVASDLPGQAAQLVAALEASLGPRRYASAWKTATVLIGGNNLCVVCSSSPDGWNSVDAYARHVDAAFAVLAAVPRMIVSVALHGDYTQLAALDWGWWGRTVCDTILEWVCPCLGSSLATEEELEIARDNIRQYNTVLRRLTTEHNARAANDPDAAVFVVQPSTEGVQFTDTSMVAYDCFHPSAEGHAALALGLWNNIIQHGAAKATTTCSPCTAEDVKWCPANDIEL